MGIGRCRCNRSHLRLRVPVQCQQETLQGATAQTLTGDVRLQRRDEISGLGQGVGLAYVKHPQPVVAYLTNLHPIGA